MRSGRTAASPGGTKWRTSKGLCAVGRARPRHAHPRLARRSSAPGQPARLRHSRRGLGGRTADADDGARPSPSTRATTTAARLRLRPRRPEHVHRPCRARLQRRADATRPATTRRRAKRSISTVQNAAGVQPGNGAGDDARQGNERENTIISNQTTLIGRLHDRRAIDTRSTAGLEFLARSSSRRRSPASAPARRSIYTPNPDDPVTGYAPARTGAYTEARRRVARLRVRRCRLGALQVNGGLRFEHYDTDFRAVDAAAWTTVDAGPTGS